MKPSSFFTLQVFVFGESLLEVDFCFLGLRLQRRAKQKYFDSSNFLRWVRDLYFAASFGSQVILFLQGFLAVLLPHEPSTG
jgi:hypothetical protein